MCTDYAANAPEFFLHHAFLDFIWIRWQNKSPGCKRAYFGEKALQLIDSPFWTSDFVDSFNQGECVKVRYDDIIKRVLKPGEYIGNYQCDLGIERAIPVEDRTCSNQM